MRVPSQTPSRVVAPTCRGRSPRRGPLAGHPGSATDRALPARASNPGRGRAPTLARRGRCTRRRCAPRPPRSHDPGAELARRSATLRYSLGMTLLFALLSRHPSTEREERRREITSLRCGPQLKTLILKATERRVEDRFASVGEFLYWLKRIAPLGPLQETLKLGRLGRVRGSSPKMLAVFERYACGLTDDPVPEFGGVRLRHLSPPPRSRRLHAEPGSC